MALIGKVVALTGTAYLIKDNGEKRELQLGDSVELGDTIQTMSGATVELAMNDGREINVPPNQLIALTEDLATIFAQEKLDGSVDLATIESVIKAIESGQDVNEVLEETAAGVAGGRTVYGFGFVNLLRINDVLNQFNFEYDYNYASSLEDDPIRGRTQDELNRDLNNLDATTPSVSLPPIGISLAATSTLSEAGGDIIYSVTLTRTSTSPMTVTLSNGLTVVIPPGQTTGTVPYTVAPDEDAYLDSTTVSATITSATGGGEATVVSTTPAETVITDTMDTTTVSLTASPSVAEGGVIVYTASLNNAAQTPVTVTLATGEIITIAAGASSGSINISAPTDDVYLDASSVSKAIATATGGNFENLVADTTPATTAITDTLDVTTISISGIASVQENGTANYTVSLTNPTQTALTVNIVYGGTAINGDDYTGVATVTIPAGASSATFSLNMIDDVLAEGTESLTVGIGATTGGNFESLVVSATNGSVTTNLIDNDVATVSLTATSTITEAGGTIVYTATITQAPVSPLTVTLDNGVTIIIPAGATSGTGNYVLAPDEDVYIDPTSVSAVITTLTGGGIISSIDPTPAVTTVTDTIDTTTVSLSATPSVAEGGNVIYTATLTSPAQGAVTVTLNNGSIITIANGATTGTVSVPAPADDVYVDAGTVSLFINTATGGNFENLVVDSTPAVTNITDTLDATTVTLSSVTNGNAITEGGSIVYTASVSSPVTGSALVVTLSNGTTI
ncbi:MAG: retention module-containing protein, partial [Methylophilus sp.]|nr:retention module-containing protein [Methylophilus sp.]